MEKKSFVGEHDELNCWISFVLYAVTGKMREADAVMKEHGDLVRAQARRQRKLSPIKERPLYRGIVLQNGCAISNNSAVELGGFGIAVSLPVDPGPNLIGEDGCVSHALEEMEFVSHTEDLECAQWFASPDAAVSAFASAVRPGIRGYVVRLPKPPSTVLWHHSWTDARTSGGRIPLSAAALQHPHIAPYVSQFLWNLETQKEVITMPSKRRFKIEPLKDVDVKALDRRFCHPDFLEE